MLPAIPRPRAKLDRPTAKLATPAEMRGRAFPGIPTGTVKRADPLAIAGSLLPRISTPSATLAMPPARPGLPWEMRGRTLPCNAMTVQARLEKVTAATDVVAGVKKHLAKRAFVWVAGKKLTPAAVIAMYEKQLAAIEAVRQAHGRYKLALAAEKRLRRPMQAFTVSLKGMVMNELGPANARDFGWKAPGKPGPKTVEAKLAGVEKRAARRRKT